jgi:hypothetical protein
MKQELKNLLRWFGSLSLLHKAYVVYWQVSFVLLLGVGECSGLLACLLVTTNFCIASRLLRRVPCDLLDE